jgi:FolB domain-containing protein
MTAMLASVTGPDEAEIAIAGGADVIDLKDTGAETLQAMSAERIAETLTAVAGRRLTSAVAGDLAADPEAALTALRSIAASGVDYVKLGLPPAETRRSAIRSLGEIAATMRLIGVLYADRESDIGAPLADLAAAGFAGIMLDTAGKSAGRLLTHVDVPRLAVFVAAARGRGLLVGLAGGLEEPDVPRLLVLEPDVLGFRSALCVARERRAGIDPAAVRAIRRLIPQRRPEGEPGNVDYRLLSARGWHPDTSEEPMKERLFVHNLVLPVRIGAYSHEREAPQKVRFDVTVDVDRPRGEPQGMAQVFSYDLITDGIASILAASPHIDFVETLAERIAAHVLRDPRARRVTVRIEKLEVGPGGVGVEITMDRPDESVGQNPVLAMLEESRRKPRT